ncbi:hypothetical protein EC968_002001 [Mortierella alpina]|nr:hypothetical protein EC968_002001 [Mortierella alpina]
MPIALPRGDRVGQWDPRHALSSFSSPCPLYSGHLLKLGSNDRWQSRLFTFDGAVLTCVGKRPRTPPIATYDPHVSSPFVSASCHPQPYNPNTKWFLNLSSITDIRLLPSSRTYRCFPYTDTSRSLVIQTADGRTLTLRAKKDLELERWYFVLAKIWSYQQLLLHPEARDAAIGLGKDEDPDQPQPQHLQQQHQLPHHNNHLQHQHGLQHGHHHHHHHHGPNHHHSHHNHHHRHHAPTAASLLPAHEQSLHLYSKYLQRQQYQHDPQEYQPEQPRSPQQQQQSQRHVRPLHQQQQSPPPHTISKARESFLRYQLPLPRVSAFLPQGFDWALQRHDEDDEDDDDDEEEEDEEEDDDEEDNIRVFLKTSFQDSPPISGDSKMNHHPGSSNTNDIKNESIERQCGSWSQERDSMPTTDLLNSSISSPGIFLQQPIVWPAAGTMAPAKAAAIDMWRRSLLSPMLMDEASSLLSDDDDSEDDFGPHHALHEGQVPKINTSITGDLGRGFTVHDQHNNTDERGPISPQSAQSRSKWFSHKEHYTRPRLALEDCQTSSSSSSASLSGDHLCGPFVPVHRRHHPAAQQQYLLPSGRIEDSVPPGMAHHNRHISLGGLEIVSSGLGIHPHEQPQQHDMHRAAVDEEDDVPAPEQLHAVRFQRWQNTQLSSEDETGTNRDSSMALTNTVDLNRSSFGTFPNRDSYMNLNNSNHLLSADPSASTKTVPVPPAISAATARAPPNKQAKKGLLTGILKRPSLPDLGSAVLAAAVAGFGGAFSSETKKRTATFVTESTVVPQPQQWTASPSTPSSSKAGSSHHLPLYDPAYVFPVPQTEILLPAPVLTNERRHQGRFEDVGPLSMPNPGSTMTLELNKGPFGLPMPRLSAAPATNSIPAQLSPPARPPRRHPLDIRFLRKPSLAAHSGRSAASVSSDQAFESQPAPLAAAPALSWTGPLSSEKADPLSSQEPPVVVRTVLPRPPQDVPRRRSSEPAVAFLGLGLDLGGDNFGEDITRDLELTSQQSYTPPPPPTIPFMSSEFRISPFDVVPGTPVEALYDLTPEQFESPKQTEKGKATETSVTESERPEHWQPRPTSYYQHPEQLDQEEQKQEQEQQSSELSPDKGSDQGPTFIPLRRSSSSTSCSKNDVLEFEEEIDCESDASASDDHLFCYF